MRLRPFSVSACDGVVNERGDKARTWPLLSRVTPLNSPEMKVEAMRSLPLNWRRAVAGTRRAAAGIGHRHVRQPAVAPSHDGCGARG
jgi:hypothetical protein